MNPIILKKEQLNELIFRLRVNAPQIAKKRKAGQFIILRIEKDGERIPLTIANADAQEGWIEIIFQAAGRSTKLLSMLNEGDALHDLVGPLGKPTHIENFGRCLCIGGGVGTAPLYPIVRALKNAGNHVTTIIGARSKDIVILEQEMKAASDELYVATDDGTYGFHGFVTDLFKKLISEGKKYDFAIVIGPPMMMKFTTALTIQAGIHTYASLNPIMVDGTGMCGGCRVTVFNETKFACVDGPEFDAAGVDWDEMLKRLNTYKTFEQQSTQTHECKLLTSFHTTTQSAQAVEKAKIRVPMREQDPKIRGDNFNEVPFGYSEAEAIAEAKRCIQCKNPLCATACPVQINIPAFIKLIAEGKFGAALRKIKETHAFPAVCGRVCPQENQCEGVCVLGKKGTPIAIGHLERFVADWQSQHKIHTTKPMTKPKNGKKVAVIGSGPAGLCAAHELIKDGFDVTIFEALHEVGGVLSYGIPEFRLPKAIVKEEIEYLEKHGVKIIKNFIVGKTATIEDLFTEEHFDAVFIGTGAGLPTFLNIPGENSIGVYSANEYLTRANLMKAFQEDSKTPIIKGKKVVTVGGGNVAMDAARTALRLGAKPSMIVYRRSETEMPARAEEIHHAKEEGIEFNLLCNPIEILSDEKGGVKALKCIRMELGDPDDQGRRKPVPKPNSEFIIECDIVIIAIGNRPNPLIKDSSQDIAFSKHGTIIANENDGRTSKKYVYAGGDIVTGAATVILAMGAAKQAAQSIKDDLLNSHKA